MSLGYNDRLKPLAWKGECGDKETVEPYEKWSKKAQDLATWIKESKHTVAFTGAGISVSSGIPDFRGPNGVWTLEKQGKKPSFDVSFESARPSFTHMALVALMNAGLLQYVVSQNVDGLHLRSGIPRDKLSELHGNIMAEKCDQCGREYVRDFDGQIQQYMLQKQNGLVFGGMGCKPTGRFCETSGCGGALRDTTIDWDSPLPDEEFDKAIEHHKKAELAICLGTSLRIRPAGNMPGRTLRKHNKSAPGKLVIINLQKTHLDRSATMRLHVRCDDIMREVCRLLDVKVDFDESSVPPTVKAENTQRLEAAAASSAAAASRAAARKASAAASSSKPKPPTPLPVARPTRTSTARLRPLYNPNMLKQEAASTSTEAAMSMAAAATSSSPPLDAVAPVAPAASPDFLAHSSAAAAESMHAVAVSAPPATSSSSLMSSSSPSPSAAPSSPPLSLTLKRPFSALEGPGTQAEPGADLPPLKQSKQEAREEMSTEAGPAASSSLAEHTGDHSASAFATASPTAMVKPEPAPSASPPLADDNTLGQME